MSERILCEGEDYCGVLKWAELSRSTKEVQQMGQSHDLDVEGRVFLGIRTDKDIPRVKGGIRVEGTPSFSLKTANKHYRLEIVEPLEGEERLYLCSSDYQEPS